MLLHLFGEMYTFPSFLSSCLTYCFNLQTVSAFLLNVRVLIFSYNFVVVVVFDFLFKIVSHCICLIGPETTLYDVGGPSVFVLLLLVE